MAIGMWLVEHHNMRRKEFRDEYWKHYPADEPRGERDDRVRLYALKERIMYSAHVGIENTRAIALEEMRDLIAKYAGADENEGGPSNGDQHDDAAGGTEAE
ncbi:hypothetical protein F5Y17DRAFT_455669 [Xylariaceae sp. FL0594]|nr:hypothetical protein F5Y17DRAFT_455669 [Xylariaceae sp. FL0594]